MAIKTKRGYAGEPEKRPEKKTEPNEVKPNLSKAVEVSVLAQYGKPMDLYSIRATEIRPGKYRVTIWRRGAEEVTPKITDQLCVLTDKEGNVTAHVSDKDCKTSPLARKY